MRWREVLQKYRWTVNYNDIHEIKKRCEYFDEMNELCGKHWKYSTLFSLLISTVLILGGEKSSIKLHFHIVLFAPKILKSKSVGVCLKLGLHKPITIGLLPSMMSF